MTVEGYITDVTKISWPKEGSRWVHTNGNVYDVLFITNEGSTRASYPVTVVYENKDTGTKWSRPLDDWFRSMTSVA